MATISHRVFSPTIDANQIRNLIMLGLPPKECDAVFRNLDFVELPANSVLNAEREQIEFVYFINGGLASFLNVMSDGKSVEVGLAGKEGFVGVGLLAGFRTSPSRVIMQVMGSGYRMAAVDFMAALSHCPTLEKSLSRYSQNLGMQAAQVAACNKLHEIDKRLARWLLMSQDRLGGSVVPLTHEFLAHMLGTRRASVTIAAGILQNASLITYRRGTVTIQDRSGLEKYSCECYKATKRLSKNWDNEANDREDPVRSSPRGMCIARVRPN